MKVFRTLSLGIIAAAFLVAFSVSSTYAQPGKGGYNGNQGKHKGWDKGKHKGWNKGKKAGWNDDWRSGSISDRERDRLRRQRQRIYNSRERYYRDGSLSSKERSKLYKQSGKYRRSVYRARRN